MVFGIFDREVHIAVNDSTGSLNPLCGNDVLFSGDVAVSHKSGYVLVYPMRWTPQHGIRTINPTCGICLLLATTNKHMVLSATQARRLRRQNYRHRMKGRHRG